MAQKKKWVWDNDLTSNLITSQVCGVLPSCHFVYNTVQNKIHNGTTNTIRDTLGYGGERLRHWKKEERRENLSWCKYAQLQKGLQWCFQSDKLTLHFLRIFTLLDYIFPHFLLLFSSWIFTIDLPHKNCNLTFYYIRDSTIFLTYIVMGTKRFIIKRELQATFSPSPAQLRNNMFFLSVLAFYLFLFSCFSVIFSPSWHSSGTECWWDNADEIILSLTPWTSFRNFFKN